MKDVDFLLKLFNTLDSRQIEYAVLRKAEKILSGDFNDIDWAIDINRKSEFNDILDDICNSLNWKIDMRIQKNGFEAIRLHSVGDQTPLLLHFDLFDSFSWKWIKIFSNKELLTDTIEKAGIKSVNASTEAIIQFLTRFLFNGYVKEEYRENIQKNWIENYEIIEKKIIQIFGNKIGSELNNYIRNAEWNTIESQVHNYRQAILNTEKDRKGLLSYTFYKQKYKLYEYRRLIKKHGLMIAFEGTDGSGKSTIIDSLPEILYRSYDSSYIDYYHWRPGLIKKDAENGKPVSQPHLKKPYNRLLSIIKIMIINLDYILGYWFKVRIQLNKGHLVIFDRYYYDYYIDKIRYRLNVSDWILDFFKLIVPKPDVTFVLVGSPQVLYARKKELSIEEITEQIQRLELKKHKFNNPKTINVNEEISIVVDKVSNVILEQLSFKRNKG